MPPFKPEDRGKSDPLLSAVPPMLRRTVGRQLQMIRLFENRPVQLVAPFDVVIK